MALSTFRVVYSGVGGPTGGAAGRECPGAQHCPHRPSCPPAVHERRHPEGQRESEGRSHLQRRGVLRDWSPDRDLPDVCHQTGSDG